MKSLTERSMEVFMRPEFGDYNLYKAKSGLFSAKSPVVAEIHVVVPVLHGTNGEDGIFEGLLDTIGIPYAGCNTLSSANGMDKITMKMILRECGIPVVDYVWFTDKEWFSRRDAIIDEVEKKLGYPVIVKPANLSSSVGIGKASDRASLMAKIDNAEKFSQRIIVEHMIEQLQEINCSVLVMPTTTTSRRSWKSLSRPETSFHTRTSIWAEARGAMACRTATSASRPNCHRM